MSQVIKEISRNEREIIRFDVSEFKEKEYINIRIWYQAFDNSGNLTYKPTQKGVALSIDKYDELKDAVDRLGMYLKDKENNCVPELNPTSEEFFSAKTEFEQEEE